MNISQSFLKEFVKMKTGEVCGLQTKAKYIDGIKFPSSEAMELGNFFEFSATGSLPRDGHIPIAKIVYKGTARESVAEPYQRAIDSSKLFKIIINAYQIEILEIGKVITNNKMTGIMDIVAKWNGRLCVIDTKYSGLIDDRWNELGWDLNSLPDKHNLLIQAVQYKLLLSSELNCSPNDVDFYFFIFSSKEVMDVKLVKVNVEEATYASHLATIELVSNEMKKPIDVVFKASPEFNRCFKCPIKEKCDKKIELPQISEITY